MTDSRNANVQVGPGLFGLCAIASIVLAILKLTNVLTVSWLIVFLPIIIGGALTIALLIIAFILLAIVASVGKCR